MIKLLKRIQFSKTIQYSKLINPYTHELLRKKQYLSEPQLFTRVTQTTSAQKLWKKQPLNKRIHLTTKFIENILRDKDQIKNIISQQLGKSSKNIDKQFEHANNIAYKLIKSSTVALQGKVLRDDEEKFEKYIFQSVGITAIFPYYSQPILDSIIHLIPCLISGGGALIKASDFNHFLGDYLVRKSNQTFQIKSLVSDIFIHPQALSSLAQFRSLKKVIYSGSQISARHIFETLVKNRFIDCNLFFGGQDAAYVDQTADLPTAAIQIAKRAFYNNGQSYDCVKRLFLHSSIKSQFQQMLVKQVQNIVLGDPKDPNTDLGPLCIQQMTQKISGYINDAINDNGVCLIGGMIVTDGKSIGSFCQPTIITNCTSDMLIVQTQLPAPILCILEVNSNESFINTVNEAQYGTGVRIFTKNPLEYKKYIDMLHVGRIAFNSALILNQNLPIEGWKRSGKGKILSQLSYYEYTLPKTYNVARKLVRKN